MRVGMKQQQLRNLINIRSKLAYCDVLAVVCVLVGCRLSTRSAKLKFHENNKHAQRNRCKYTAKPIGSDTLTIIVIFGYKKK